MAFKGEGKVSRAVNCDKATGLLKGRQHDFVKSFQVRVTEMYVGLGKNKNNNNNNNNNNKVQQQSAADPFWSF